MIFVSFHKSPASEMERKQSKRNETIISCYEIRVESVSFFLLRSSRCDHIAIHPAIISCPHEQKTILRQQSLQKTVQSLAEKEK